MRQFIVRTDFQKSNQRTYTSFYSYGNIDYEEFHSRKF